jgi:prophage DNA circulation protein
MFKNDATEAKPIVDVTLDTLLTWTATRGRTGADLRSIVGDTKAYAIPLLQADLIGSALIMCFEAAYLAGINLQQMEHVRKTAAAQKAVSVGAIMTKDTMIQLALSIEGEIIGGTNFISREDVVKTRELVNASFVEIEEEIADQMDAMTWRALIKVHAAISMFMYETARPLPRMLNFRFGYPMPTLVMAHKLYADAGRADELRNENKVVHPGFARPYGRALSA